jgi:hypothetical protein
LKTPTSASELGEFLVLKLLLDSRGDVVARWKAHQFAIELLSSSTSIRDHLKFGVAALSERLGLIVDGQDSGYNAVTRVAKRERGLNEIATCVLEVLARLDARNT